MVAYFDIGSDRTRVAAISYTDEILTVFKLGTHNTLVIWSPFFEDATDLPQADLSCALAGVPRAEGRGETFTGSALQRAREQFTVEK